MPKHRRNDPCRCNSGRKYKHCCLNKDGHAASSPFSKILTFESRDAEGLNSNGLIALQSGNVESAIEFFEWAIEEDGMEPNFHCNLGLALRASGRLCESIKVFERALRLDPESICILENMGIALFEGGRVDEAVRCFEAVLAKTSHSARALSNLGNALSSSGKPHAAAALLQRAVELDPASAAAQNNLGNVLSAMGDFAAAIDCYRLARLIEPDHVPVLCNLGKALCAFGKVEEAIVAYRHALSVQPGSAEARCGLGLMLLESGRRSEAIDELTRALGIAPGLAEAHFHLHSLVLDSANLEPAISHLRRVIELSPKDTDARVRLAILLDWSTGSSLPIFEDPDFHPLQVSTLALIDSCRYLRSQCAVLPSLVGISRDAFDLGLAEAAVPGLVLEFGVRFGTSIRQIAQIANQEAHGFDSFEGLPEAWHDEKRGSYSTFGEAPAVPANVVLHRGWFEETLPSFLASHPGSVRFANIDCDIYSSTKTVLGYLAPRIVPGSILVFDEYFAHEHWRIDEHRAFVEAATRHRWRYDYVGFGMCTNQAVIRIRQ